MMMMVFSAVLQYHIVLYYWKCLPRQQQGHAACNAVAPDSDVQLSKRPSVYLPCFVRDLHGRVIAFLHLHLHNLSFPMAWMLR
jgi:hypothetical protein